jgi:hypothetical protein
MSWRKWLVRALVFSVLGTVTAAAILYQRWTNPAAVRREAIRKLSAHFPGASVSVDSARWRLLGGISLNELRLSRRDDPEKREFAYIPSAIVYPDKEQMNDGKVAIRKIVLERPRLRLIRQSDGTWNVSGLMAAPRPEEPVPILVIQQGTIVVEDRSASSGWPALEIKNVNLTLVSDSHASLTFQGTGSCDLTGSVQFNGTYQRPSQDTSVSIQASAIAIEASLAERWSRYCPDLKEHAAGLEGTGSVQADLRFRPQATPSWKYQVGWRLSRGQFRHPQLPLPLKDIEARGQCGPGRVTVEELTAHAGGASVKLEGTAQSLRLDADFIGKLTVENLPLTRELFARLPAKLQKLNDYSPEGAVDISSHCERSAGRWFAHCEVSPREISAEHIRFPYRVERLTGKLIHELDGRKEPKAEAVNVDLTGYAGSQPVRIKGTVIGEGRDSAVAVKIWADNLPLDKKLLAALDPERQKLARMFHPTGQANVVAEIQREAFSQKFKNRYLIHFHHAAARYDVFPYPLENVEGDLDILPDHWEFRNFSGTHKGCQVTTWGTSRPTADGSRLMVNIAGRSLLLDSELESALQPELKKAWKSFQPTGRMDFTAAVETLGKQTPDVKVTVIPQDCTVQPIFFPYLLSHLSGSLYYENNHVRLEKLRASHGRTIMTVDVINVQLKPEGGVFAKLQNLRGTPLLVENDLRQAMPGVLRRVCESLGLEAAVQLKADLLIINTFADGGPPATVYWDGEIDLQNVNLRAGVQLEGVTGKVACRGSCKGDRLQNEPGHSPLMGNLVIQQALILNQPFHDIHCGLEVPEANPTVLLLRGIHGRVFDGEVYGETRVELVAPYRYELNLTAAQLRLEEFARHNLKPGFKMSGLGNARLYLTGTGSDRKTLQGHGILDVPKGKIYELNFLLDLLKILNLRVPDGTAFEEAHGVFAIKGERVQISKLDLFGTPFSLGGKGEMNLDGSDLHLEFYAVWARVMQVLPPVIKEIPKVLSQQILKITLHGSLGVKVESTKEPVPILVDPLKELLKAMQGRKTTTPAGMGSGN